MMEYPDEFSDEQIKLTKEFALYQIEKLREVAEVDDEGAHALEDYLYVWFIRCVAAGMYEPDEVVEIAKIVELADDIPFSRWRA